MTIQSFLFQDDLVLAGVFWLLLVMSALTWFLACYKLLGLCLASWHVRGFNQNWQAKRMYSDWAELKSKAKGEMHLFFSEGERSISGAGPSVDHKFTEQVIKRTFSHALDTLKLRTDAGLSVLASIGTSAPFIGLFGTVWGIYNTLTAISQQTSASLSVVSGPMGEALLATAMGLFAAIPAVLIYNTFIRLNRIHCQKLRHLAEGLQFVCYQDFLKHTNRAGG